MKFGTNYRVKVLSTANERLMFDMDIHEMLMRMWSSGFLPVQHIGEIEIEIERDGVRVEKRLPAWLEYEEN